MTYVVARDSGTWEIRESRATPRGPRSQTLASFRVLTPEVIEHARGRAGKPLLAEGLRRAAMRAGAPIAPRPPDRAAGELLAELAHGRQPRGALRRLLLDALRDGGEGSSDNTRAAGAWIAATPGERGEALRDLLLLSDRLPPSRIRTASRPRFPRIHTAVA
jgi:hypothetical protein